MPTYSWIFEKDRDAFFENQPVQTAAGPIAPVYKCPFCEFVNTSARDLDHHVVEAHSVSRPFLLTEGREPPRHVIRRTPIAPSNVHLANSTKVIVRINDQPAKQIPPTDLATVLSSVRRGNVVLTLFNSTKANVPEVAETYRLTFRLADTATLRGVETAFNEIVTPSDLAIAAIDAFLSDSRCAGDGSDYAESLANFALGILRKEDPDSAQLTTPGRLYRSNYVSAEEGLRDLERPLAKLITQITRFALNDFSAEPIDTGYSELDSAYRLLRDPVSSPISIAVDSKENRVHACPVDHDTGRILTLAARMLNQERWSTLLSEECRDVTHSRSLEAVDQQKAAAIWAACAWRRGARQEAAEPLRLIAATYPFERWAAPLLEEFDK